MQFGAVTQRLALFALVSVLLVNGLLALLGQRGALDETRLFLRGVQGVDSWGPMKQAYAIATVDAEQPLYQTLFFEGRIKFVYPPSSLLLFRALDLSLPEAAWQRALNRFSWICVAFTILCSAWILDRTLARAAPSRSAADRAMRIALASLLGVTFYPLLKAYTLGQLQVFVNACLAALLAGWLLGWRGTSGVLVAAMAAVKPHYALFLFWGVLRREWRFAAFAAAAGLALLVASLVCFGLADHLDYLRVLAHVGRHGEAYWPNQSLNGFLQRLLGNAESGSWDPHVYPPFHPWIYAATLAGSVALLALGLLWPRRPRPRGDVVDLAGFALALTLASPLAWEHHYGVLLPILAVALGAALERRLWNGWAVWVLASCALIASHHVQALGRLSGAVWNPLQSLLFFSALMLLALLLGERRRAAIG